MPNRYSSEKRGLSRPEQPMGDAKLILWIGLAVLAAMLFLGPLRGPKATSIAYTEFKSQVRQDNVSEVRIQGDKIKGVLNEPRKFGAKEEGAPAFKHFTTVKPPFEDRQILPLLEEKEVAVQAKSTEGTWLNVLLVSLLPWILIIALLIYSSRKMREKMGGGMGGGIFGFAKSKAKLFTKSKSDVGFKDVAGLENAKKELQEVVDYLKEPDKVHALGGELPNGLLLIGPPGTGKTLLARAVAGEADVPFYSISGSEFIEMFVGVGASRVRDMFARAKKEAPSIIFVDELDSIGRVRGTGLGGGHDEREQTLNQILNEMDGFSPQQSVVVLAATNRPDVLDPALVRPGRFDRQITLELPQKKARKEILKLHIREVPVADDVDLDLLAGSTVGFSGAQLKNLVNESALLGARKKKERVGMKEFDEAIDKIRMGIEREDLINDDERKTIAYHEAGHALVAQLLPGSDPLKKVTIIPRGHSLGATEQLPEEDRHNLGRRYLLNRIAIMLAGRASEKVVFEDLTSGAGDDLKKATQLARRMVCQWGMSEKLGPVTFRHGETHPFLGREMAQPKDFSEHTARVIDDEIRKMIGNMENRAKNLLETNRRALDILAQALLKHETLEQDDVVRILNQHHSVREEEKKTGTNDG